MDALELNGWLWLAWSSCWFVAAAFTHRKNIKAETLCARLSHTLPTVLGFVLIFFISLGPKLQGPSFLLHTITLLGLTYTFWARLHLGKNWSGLVTIKNGHELIRSGPYRWTRHPIYTGILLASLGSALVNGTSFGLLGWLILILTYVQKAKREERGLTEEFGESYLSYALKTPRLLPFRIETSQGEKRR